MASLANAAVDQCSHSREIERFRREQALIEHKDQLTTIFVNGPSVANRELYAPLEEIAEEFKPAKVEREFLRKAVESYSRKHSEKKNPENLDRLERCEDFAALEQVLQEQANQWTQKKRFLQGNVQNVFHRVCKTLDGHQSILSAIPESNQYVSVFCAGLKTVIQASLNHQVTAESLLRDVATINEVVSCALERANLFQTKAVTGKFAKLYANIFYFYTAAIGWYASKSSYKIRLSLNKNSYDEMAGHIEEIQRIGQTIQSRAEIGSQAELRDVHLDVQTLLIQQQSLREIIGKQGEARNDAEEIHRRQLEQFIIALVDEQRRNLERLSVDINQNLVTVLKEISQQNILSRPVAQGPRDAESEQSMIVDRIVPTKSLAKTNTYNRDILMSECTALQDFIIVNDLVESMLKEPQTRSLSNVMFHRLQTFILSERSESLWLLGQSDIRYPSGMSGAAACIVSVLSQGVPQLIYHFCALEGDGRQASSNSLSDEESGLISLVYSLITQLVYALKPRFESPIDFQHHRFSKLDGSMATFTDALKLFEDLVQISLPYIICVIDGMQWLDYGRGSSRCEEFLASIRNVMMKRRRGRLMNEEEEEEENKTESNGIFKILFTTAGNSTTLMNVLDAEDIFEDNDGMYSWRNNFQQTGQGMMSLTEL